MDRMYAPTPDGYCGDEDNGQTSAWYVFSSLGFYPVTPGVNQYVLGTPLFPKASVKLENGRTLSIRARGQGRYVDALRIDGKKVERNWVSHAELMRGAKLDFSMSDKPNQTRGTKEEDAPYSFSTAAEEKQ